MTDDLGHLWGETVLPSGIIMPTILMQASEPQMKEARQRYNLLLARYNRICDMWDAAESN